METTTEPSIAVRLPPRLAEVFQLLRVGRHICRDDRSAWYDLREHLEDYRRLFSALGYSLQDHPKGFFYFAQGQQERPQVMTRLVYFFTCLFTDLDQGRFEIGRSRWVDALTSLEFDLEVVIESMYSASDRQRVFDLLDVPKDGFDKGIIAPLIRYGIAVRCDDRKIRFRESVARFVELFQEIGDNDVIVERSGEGQAARVADEDELDDSMNEGAR